MPAAALAAGAAFQVVLLGKASVAFGGKIKITWLHGNFFVITAHVAKIQFLNALG